MLLFVALSVYYLAVYLSFLLIGIVGALFLVITLLGASDSDSCSLCWDQGHNTSYSRGHLMLPRGCSAIPEIFGDYSCEVRWFRSGPEEGADPDLLLLSSLTLLVRVLRCFLDCI